MTTQERMNLTKALLLVAALFIAYALSGCMTFQKAKSRYATTITDTTFSHVTLTVPHDSVVHVMKNDTVHERRIERYTQGRATLTIIREPTNTTVLADCAEARKDTLVATHVDNNQWGVSKHYETATKVLGFIVLAIVLAYVLMHVVQVNVSKR